MSTTPTQEQADMQRAHPPTKELHEMNTHELVYELAIAEQFESRIGVLTPEAEARCFQVQMELGRRFPQSWIATGERKGGE